MSYRHEAQNEEARVSTAKSKAKDGGLRTEAAAETAPVGHARFYNRELSWLQFNRRVLEEAFNTNHPLLERVRFLSISASNLDEFYMVRVAGIYGQVTAGVGHLTQDGLTPPQQLAEINRFAASLVSDQQACWTALKAEMDEAGIRLVDAKQLRPEERQWLETEFLTHIFPILTPIAVDPAHPFPFIQNRGLTIGLELKREKDGKTMHALLPIPAQLDRFLRLPSLSIAGPDPSDIRFIRIETLIAMFLGRLFPGFIARSHGAFRVLRDSEIEVQEEAEDLVRSF
ncbi:MAG: RNA degradosome polyphosphate kinase, partial [Hyphomicrobiaceae bacterium]